MDNALCRMTGAEFPLFAFSHCRDVVVAVSKAGGFGVFGAAAYTPEQFEQELAWIDAHIDGKPYGVDVLVPETVDPRVTQFTSNAQRAAAISDEHKSFTADLLGRYGVSIPDSEALRIREGAGITPENGQALMEVPFRHPIRLIAYALGIAPPEMIAEGKKRGIPVAGDDDRDVRVIRTRELDRHAREVLDLVRHRFDRGLHALRGGAVGVQVPCQVHHEGDAFGVGRFGHGGRMREAHKHGMGGGECTRQHGFA